MTKTIQIILTPAMIFALSVTRRVAIPAPPAGFVNNFFCAAHEMDYGSAAYTGATKLIYESESGTNILEDSAILPATADKETVALKSQATQGTFSTTKAIYVTADGVGADGDSTINGFLSYEQVQIGA